MVARCWSNVFGGHHNLDLAAAIDEVAGRAQAPAAVVAPSGENRYGAGGGQLIGELCQIRTGMLHHLEQIDTEFVDGQPVRLNHLLDGEPWHGLGGDLRVAGHESQAKRWAEGPRCDYLPDPVGPCATLHAVRSL